MRVSETARWFSSNLVDGWRSVKRLCRLTKGVTAVFTIIESVDRVGFGCRLMVVLRACFYALRSTGMLAAHDRANIYDALCISRQMAAELGMRFAWLRLFSSYGPMDGPDWMIPYLIRTLLRGATPALTPGE